MADKKHVFDEDFIDADEDLMFDDNDIDEYYKERDKTKNKAARRNTMIAAMVAVLICILAVAAMITVSVVDSYTPNSTVLTLYEYYGLDAEAYEAGLDKQIVSADIYCNSELIDNKMYLIGGVWYFDKDTVDELFNPRFYYDIGNDNLIYTTPSKIFTIPFDSQVYFVDNDTKKESYVIARKIDDVIYIAVDYVRARADFIYEVREAPYRAVITTQYGKSEYAIISEEAKIRQDATIKAPILSEGSGDDDWKVMAINGEWTGLTTDDGRVGYVKSKDITGSYIVTTSNSYQPPIYTSVSKNYKINLVWHAIYSDNDNYDIYPFLDRTSGVTTVSPTWYQIVDSDGNISSYANQEYVDYVHELGMEVWPLISDFLSADEEKGWNEYELFSVTEKRRNLISNIMNEIETYGVDGINIDFEKVSSETGIHYVQFLRELSIECRKAGVVLSIDNYVPMPHSLHYDREEQGVIADYIIVMGYDEHYRGGEPGSVASIDFVTKGIVNTLEMVPADKLINGLPFYTRVWYEGTDEEGNHVSDSKTYSMTGSWEFVEENDFLVVWDDELQQYVANGTVDNYTYTVWLEDVKSIEAKMKVVQQYKLAGVAAWNLGCEDEAVWNVINTYNHK